MWTHLPSTALAGEHLSPTSPPQGTCPRPESRKSLSSSPEWAPGRNHCVSSLRIPGQLSAPPTVTVQSKKGYSGRVTASLQGGVYVFLDSKSPRSGDLNDPLPAGRMALGRGRGRECSRPRRVPVGTAGPSNSRSHREGLCSEQPPPPSLKDEVVCFCTPSSYQRASGAPSRVCTAADIPVGLQPPPHLIRCSGLQMSGFPAERPPPRPSPSHLVCFTDRPQSYKAPFPQNPEPSFQGQARVSHLVDPETPGGRAQPLF